MILLCMISYLTYVKREVGMYKGNIVGKIQKFGGFLSGMVMPNIGAFITWGLITACFLNTGWFPNPILAELISPMLKYLLPTLIGFTGGRLVYGIRGGVIGSAATMGVIVGSSIPMFMGAMIMGPFAAFCLKYLDKILEGKIKPGLEMLVDNFSSGILGVFLVILAFYSIGPFVESFNLILSAGVKVVVDNNMIPFASVFIEPAKVLFLNNAINHGILSPIGIVEAAQTGKSILFLLEPNPGQAVGMLIAYSFFGKGIAKATAPGVAVIIGIGGIHEPYFPFILMKPILLIPMILGGIAGNYIFYIFDCGLVATSSPGSVFSILAVAPRAYYLPIILGMSVSFVISFVLSSLILKISPNKEENNDLEKAIKLKNEIKNRKNSTQETANSLNIVSKNSYVFNSMLNIVFACDAGMGSSAMGASILTKKLNDAGFKIKIKNYAISQLPDDVDIIITHKSLLERVKNAKPDKKYITVNNFLSSPVYDEIVTNFINAGNNDENKKN